MDCRYLLVAGLKDDASRTDLAERASLQGLDVRQGRDDAILFTSPSTPTVAAPDGAVVIGSVFRRDGAPQRGDIGRVGVADSAQLRAHLVECYWGDYVLVQSPPNHPSSLAVTRDPSGGLPCVYVTGRDVSFVTSDITLATQLGLYRKQVDWAALAHFLSHPYSKSERTALTGVRELLPGTTLHLGSADSRVSLTWSPWFFVEARHRLTTFNQAVAKLRTTVQRTVAGWARLDHSILVELSGGLDSSIVAASLHDARVHVACATLVAELRGADERVYAAAVAKELGMRLHAERLAVADAAFDAAPAASATGPGAGPLQHAADRIMERVAAREGIGTFYSGGGGDTVLGYLSSAAPAADAFRDRGLTFGLRAAHDLAQLHRCTTWRAVALAARTLVRQGRWTPVPVTDLLHADAVVQVADPHPWAGAPEGSRPGDVERVMGLAGTQLFRDGLERGTRRALRLPLLSQPVMETCLSIPSWMWNQGGVDRAVARAAFAGLLPHAVIERRSKGNFIQYNGAVYQRHKARMRDYLMDGVVQAQGLLDRDAIERFFKRPQHARDRSFMRIFDLCRTECWARHQF